VLEYSGEPPAFCSNCGNRLAQAATAPFDPEAETLAPCDGAAPGPADVPEQVGGYRIVRPLGCGGMGKVYEAEEVASGRHVALKLIAPDFAGSAPTVERFRREGRLASAIVHPRCVFVLAADEDAGRPYIVMEMMPGDTLETLVKEKRPLPVGQAVAKILDVIDGLREAHRQGVIHRDIKPSNCFLEADGRVKVGDFGLAKSLVSQTNLTRTGQFLGTLLYSAPEQVRGDPADPQTDLYAVAATLYFLLTGRAPFQTGDAASTLARIVADPVPPLRTLRPELPAALDQVVLRGLERDRQKRWRNLDELREALLPFAPGRPSIGDLGLRFGAFLLDYLILAPLILADFVLLQWVAAREVPVPLVRVMESVYLLLLLAYYGLPEGLWGWTPGKRCLGLRVWTATGTDPPGVWRALFRAGVWLTVVTLPNEIGWFVFDPYQLSRDQNLALLVGGIQLAVLALGLVLMLGTMRARNGYRCLHDLVSGTRVVCLPEPERSWSVAGRHLDEDLAPAEGVPSRLGCYTVRGELRHAAGERVFLGEDPSLGRQVLLWLRPAAEPALGAARRNLTRPTRLRWLAVGHLEDMQWDAFLAPVGCSLSDLVTAGGKLAWPQARAVLEQVADELAAATADGTLPRSLEVGQVWVRANGQVVLLEVPLRDAAPGKAPRPGAGAASEGPQGIALLRETAVLALEGEPSAPDAPPGPVRAPLPGYAARILGQLLPDSPRPYADVGRFQADLAATRGRPAEVSRARRVSQLGVLSTFVAVGLGFMVLVGAIASCTLAFDVLLHARNLEEAQRDLDRGARGRFQLSTLNPNLPTLVAAAAVLSADLDLDRQLTRRRQTDEEEHRARLQSMSWPARWFTLTFEEQQMAAIEATEAASPQPTPQWIVQSSAAFFYHDTAASWAGSSSPRVDPAIQLGFLIALALGPALWVLWAFFLRGGLSLRLLGLALVRGDGRPAARWQCAWRALLLWGPLTALLAASLTLDFWYWSVWDSTQPHPWAPWLILLLWWGAWALLPPYALLALRRPDRTVLDRLAATYLVPR
jgi:hypothetical protein